MPSIFALASSASRSIGSRDLDARPFGSRYATAFIGRPRFLAAFAMLFLVACLSCRAACSTLKSLPVSTLARLMETLRIR
jgi:hypothetical protein